MRARSPPKASCIVLMASCKPDGYDKARRYQLIKNKAVAITQRGLKGTHALLLTVPDRGSSTPFTSCVAPSLHFARRTSPNEPVPGFGEPAQA